MPARLLDHDQRDERHAWYASRGLTTWPDQYAALKAARKAHNINVPDPRLIIFNRDETPMPNQPLTATWAEFEGER